MSLHSRSAVSSRGDLWAVVLAGGAGRRLSAVTGSIPKQFWRHGGEPSLLDDTLARISQLTPPERTVLVVDRAHVPFLEHAQSDRAGHILFQPRDRGTAPGLSLGLLPVLDAGDEAIVVVTPSDHGVANGARFRASLLEAAAAVRGGACDVILFGATPFEPCTDYGWIALGAPVGSVGRGRDPHFRRVAGFVEKPSLQDAQALHRSGAVWNTLVIVARAGALVALIERHAPRAAGVFHAAASLRGAARDLLLAQQYAELPPVDLSRDILTDAHGLAAAVWPASLGWTDLGTPERLLRWRTMREAGAVRAGRRQTARAAS